MNLPKKINARANFIPMKIKSFITGFLICVAMGLHIPLAQAFYSPVLQKEAGEIQQHIIKSKQKNGHGSFYDIGKKLVKNKQEHGGILNIFRGALFEITLRGVNKSLVDIGLFFNYWDVNKTVVTTCLRDDIWELQAMQEAVADEMLKAALLSDAENANILWNDYQLLLKRLEGGTLVRDGKDEIIFGLKDTYKSAYWFPDSQQFYVSCPYGEYKQALQKLNESFRKFTGIPGTQALGSFKSISAIAKQRAVIRARQWIRANQLSFTLGGPQGGNPTSLVNGPGLQGLKADFTKEWVFASKLIDEIVVKSLGKSFGSLGMVKVTDPATQKEILVPRQSVEINQYVLNYEQAQQARQLATEQLERAIRFNLNLNYVSENSLEQLEQTMVTLNTTIKSGFDGKTGKNIPTICKQLSAMVKKQCTNHQAGIDILCGK